METVALIVGELLTIVGIIGTYVRFVPPNDGALAITGAIIFAAGLIAKAIGTSRPHDTASHAG